MNDIEYEFYNDVKDTLSDYNCTFSYYHDDGVFTVGVSFDYDEWGWHVDEIDSDLDDLFDDWDGDWDNDCNEYEVWLNNDD
ncbi:MAG: hypothetical protein HDR38_05620 [Treponema sp.]|nr:hypothetical protein [Treponema sp.]